MSRCYGGGQPYVSALGRKTAGKADHDPSVQLIGHHSGAVFWLNLIFTEGAEVIKGDASATQVPYLMLAGALLLLAGIAKLTLPKLSGQTVESMPYQGQHGVIVT